MKKVLLIVGLICSFAMAGNFNGQQSLNGLGTTRIFSAPYNGYFFINGQLTLPHLTQNAPNSVDSQVIATVSKNGATLLYTGVAGATGFTIYQMNLVTPDYVSVNLASTATPDRGLNAVTGQVYFGNTF